MANLQVVLLTFKGLPQQMEKLATTNSIIFKFIDVEIQVSI